MKRLTIRALLFGAILSVAVGIAHAENQSAPPKKSRSAIAHEMFVERCKSAGEFIHRTVENVEGVYLLKLRPEGINYGDQFRMNDPYGHDFGGDAYIKSFLRGFFEANFKRPDHPGNVVYPHIAYRYVEALDPADGKRYRYTGSMKVVGRKNPNTPNHQIELKRNPNFDLNNYAFVLDKIPAPGAPPRYGVTYDDISTREERDYWIAGSSLKIIDLQTNEVIAERIGYMMDPGQGAKGGGRAPWLLAADTPCPESASRFGATSQRLQTENFVEKVLKPTGGELK